MVIVLPQNEKPSEELQQLAPIATTKGIYVDYMGQEANSGSINFSSRTFNIIWTGDKILGVSAMEYSKCAKCLMETFEGSWHYPKNDRLLSILLAHIPLLFYILLAWKNANTDLPLLGF